MEIKMVKDVVVINTEKTLMRISELIKGNKIDPCIMDGIDDKYFNGSVTTKRRIKGIIKTLNRERDLSNTCVKGMIEELNNSLTAVLLRMMLDSGITDKDVLLKVSEKILTVYIDNKTKISDIS